MSSMYVHMYVYRLTMATRAEKSTKLAHSAHSASKTETETNRNRIQIRATLCQPPHLSGRTASVSGAETSFSFFLCQRAKCSSSSSCCCCYSIFCSQLEAQLLCVCAMTFRRLQELSHTHPHPHTRTQTQQLCCCRRAVRCIHPLYIYGYI